MGKKRRAWFRVADEVAFEDLSNDQLACLVRLMALMNTRWARLGLDGEAAGRISLGLAELYLITGKHRKDVALKLLRSLAESTGLEVGGCEVAARWLPGGAQVAARWRAGDGQVTEIIWAKYPVFQGMASPTPTQPPPPPPPPPQEREKAPPKRPKKWSGEFPDPIPPELRDELLAWASRGASTPAGRVYPSEQDVDAGIEGLGLWAIGKGERKRCWASALKKSIREDHISGRSRGRRENVTDIIGDIERSIDRGEGKGPNDRTPVRPLRIGPGRHAAGD